MDASLTDPNQEQLQVLKTHHPLLSPAIDAPLIGERAATRGRRRSATEGGDAHAGVKRASVRHERCSGDTSREHLDRRAAQGRWMGDGAAGEAHGAAYRARWRCDGRRR